MNKRKKKLLKHYPWWDYTSMLYMIRDWTAHASKMHKEQGTHLNADALARKLKLISLLCDRLIKDDYQEHKVLFPKVAMEIEYKGKGVYVPSKYTPNEETYKRITKRNNKHIERQRNEDLKYLTELINKHLFDFWD